MSLWRQLSRGLRSLTDRPTTDAEVAAEVRDFHERVVAEQMARGVSRPEAERIARLQVGSQAGVREEVRSYGWENAVESFVVDVQYAFRRLRKTPGFTVVAIATLALGIGASTAIFSAVNPVLFESLPYPGAKQLVWMQDQTGDGGTIPMTYGNYRELLARAKDFASIAANRSWTPTLLGGKRPERLEGQRVSANYFQTLGVAPAIGRDFDPVDDHNGGRLSVVLSQALWRRAFGADSAIIGRRVKLSDNDYLVMGVMPTSFESPSGAPAELWSLLQYERTLPSEGPEWGHNLAIVGRVRDGSSVDDARREIAGIAATPVPEFARPPWAKMKPAPVVLSLHEQSTRAVRPALLAVLGAVALLLVIACVNVANLLLARGAQRRAELAMRAAHGAGRGRLARQLLTETVVLALVGGLLGVIVAQAGVAALKAAAPANLPRLSAVDVNTASLLFAIGVSTLVGIAIGIGPALHRSPDLKSSISEGSGRVAGGHQAVRRVLVVSEVALALVLLVGAGLLYRSVGRLFDVDTGFRANGLVTMRLYIGGNQFGSPNDIFAFVSRSIEAVRKVPGVDRAAFTSLLPLSGDFQEYGTHFESSPNGRNDGSTERYAVTPGYLETMGIPVVRGRTIESTDRLGAPPVVLLNESFAKRKFPGMDPIGQRMRIGPDRGAWLTVIGIVKDVKQLSLAGEVSDAAYLPFDQSFFPDQELTLVARTTGNPLTLAPSLMGAIWSADPTQPIARVATMDQVIASSAAQRKFALMLFEVFAGAALILAALGIYGVLSGSVSERLREIGVRSALGASASEIVAMVLRQGLGLTAAGMLLGVIGSMASARLLDTLLYQVSRLDPVTYLAVAGVLALVACLSCWIPAVRATRVDPVLTLRD